ncbi:ferritin-like fold-containing protein [Xylanimonas ulmi]|uniref:tRNA-(MS[2]IO[6]A)-hydroxylase MiaE-like protein n=1 Tax=Xylanimonas ulmi TaxID=228973 RepID=A0A4Q7M984_9MICO|nr:ferritin-like fold-containing protein [Xylanibacterium ulmi]RZS63278.1 tRNA-(MS[2]IO[6]A)-hydroxylase MiaE-like protein [Xylanibacterium ulmi]
MSEQPTVAHDVVRRAGDGPFLEVTGLAAYVRLGLFGLIGAHTWDAPDLASAQRMVTIGLRVGEQQRALLAIGAAHGVEPVALMAPFAGVLDSFEARTAESTWWEGLLKGVVGHGVASDLCRLLARGLPSGLAAEVGAAMAYHDDDERSTAIIRAGVDADERLASRLALWGRRVVGESLSLSQTLLVTRPSFGVLAQAVTPSDADTDDGDAAPAGAVAWVLSELTAEHTRRMDRMGLAA